MFVISKITNSVYNLERLTWNLTLH